MDRNYINLQNLGSGQSPSSQYMSQSEGVGTEIFDNPNWTPFATAHNADIRQAKLNQQQHQNAMLQMERSQSYNLQNMAVQNQYQIDAEKRAQEWNDVGAQIARGQRAGVSALATLGAGSSQSMGVSSAPSTNTPQPVGASAGSSHSGTPPLQVLSQIVNTSLQAKSFNADINLKNAEAANLRQQASESFSRTFGNWIDNSFKPYLNSANLDKAQSEALSAKCKAIVESYWITGKDESGNPLYQSKIRTELRDAIASAGLKEQEADTSFAMMWNFITSGYKNISEGKLADEQVADLQGTRDSRNRANNASARNDEASAKFKELNNEMFEKYGVSYNSSLSGAIVQGTGKFLEDVSKFLNPGMQNPEGYVELIKSITDHDIKDFNELLRYISPAHRTMQDNFLDACKRFKIVISGKDSTVRNAIDISNPMSGIW